MGRIKQDELVERKKPSESSVRSLSQLGSSDNVEGSHGNTTPQPSAPPEEFKGSHGSPTPVSFPPPPVSPGEVKGSYGSPSPASFPPPAAPPEDVKGSYGSPPPVPFPRPASSREDVKGSHGSPPPAPYPPPPDSPEDLKGSPPPVAFPPPVTFPLPAAHLPEQDVFLSVGNPWTTGLFDCHEHFPNAILTAFCPCVTFGQIVEILDNGTSSCAMASLMYALLGSAVCSHWTMGTIYRARLRAKYNLVEAPTQDCIAHAFCPLCSLCQEFRELRNRGIDPSLGWNGNVALRHQLKHQVTTIPPLSQSMSK